MTIIHILGGTGYSGAAIAREAVARGHEVVSVSRTPPTETIESVHYLTLDLTDAGAVETATADADVVVGTLSPRGDMVGALPALYARVAASMARAEARLIVVGGFGSLRPAPGAPRFFEGDEFSAEYVEESRELGQVLDTLLADADGDWLFLSPAMMYGAQFPGEATGRYRTGDDVALSTADGSPTTLSGADFATAVLDEIESGAHHRAHLGFAN